MKLKDLLNEGRSVSDQKFADMLKKKRWVEDFAKDENGKENYDKLVRTPLGDHDVIWVRDGAVIMSAEHPATTMLADYYGEYRGGYPYIDQKLEDFAAKYDRTIEWIDPGTIGFYRY